MAALILVLIGIPVIFLTIRLVAHAVDPTSYGPAGGYDIYSALVAGAMYTFGFMVAAALGATAGSIDLTEGMFRHLVVTGRSRLALYLARIPAGLAIVVPLVAVGFTIVCAVCVFAAPTKLTYTGASVPAGLSKAGLQQWAAAHPKEVICNFGSFNGPTVNVNCGNGTFIGLPPGAVVKHGPSGAQQAITTRPATSAQMRSAAVQIAKSDYQGYAKLFLYPSTSLMVRSGLWLELEAVVAFIVALGLGSLIGQRTVTVVLMIVLEVILTPALARSYIPHFINLQRSLVGLATVHLEPAGLHLPLLFGGGGQRVGPSGRIITPLVPESHAWAAIVIVIWLVSWTALGAWRMATRDA